MIGFIRTIQQSVLTRLRNHIIPVYNQTPGLRARGDLREKIPEIPGTGRIA